jgi:hypothetical protein
MSWRVRLPAISLRKRIMSADPPAKLIDCECARTHHSYTGDEQWTLIKCTRQVNHQDATDSANDLRIYVFNISLYSKFKDFQIKSDSIRKFYLMQRIVAPVNDLKDLHPEALQQHTAKQRDGNPWHWRNEHQRELSSLPITSNYWSN